MRNTRSFNIPADAIENAARSTQEHGSEREWVLEKLGEEM